MASEDTKYLKTLTCVPVVLVSQGKLRKDHQRAPKVHSLVSDKGWPQAGKRNTDISKRQKTVT